MDELAQLIGADPIQFRLRYLEDERARAVVEAAAEAASWQPRIRPRDDGHGRGFAFSQYKNRQCYIAVVVDLSADRSSGVVRLERVVIAADVGQIVNPAGLSNQLEGACLQSASWTLREEVTFDRHGVTSVDWQTYPILRLVDAPEIETVLLNRPGHAWLGVGEGAMGPTPAAIANAIYDAVGIRLRQIPFTAERVRAGGRVAGK
jgi:CO/xanthine dehydrogenase Mo-binding subunit